MARPGDIERGREALAAGRWGEAYARLAAADRAAGLGADDLERLATAAYLVGRDAEALAAWTRLHHACIADGEVARAAPWRIRAMRGRSRVPILCPQPSRTGGIR